MSQLDINALIQALPATGGRVFLPSGTWDCAPVTVDRPCIIEGAGPGFGTKSSTILRFGSGSIGFDITTPGAATKLAHFRIENQPNATLLGKAKHGIMIRGHRCSVEDVQITGMGSHGLVILGMSPDNANNWRLTQVRVDFCDGHGFFIDGGDSNAGMAHGIDATANQGWGVFDSSFLGNTWTGCHVSSNILGAYAVDPLSLANYSTFIGCYAEGNQPASNFLASTQVLVVGGNIAGSALVNQRIGYNRTKFAGGDGDMQISGPTGGTTPSALAVRLGVGKHIYMFRRETSVNTPAWKKNTWQIAWVNSGGAGVAALGVTDETAPSGPGQLRILAPTNDTPWLFHVKSIVTFTGDWQLVILPDVRIGQGTGTLTCQVSVEASNPVDVGGYSLPAVVAPTLPKVQVWVRGTANETGVVWVRCERSTT